MIGDRCPIEPVERYLAWLTAIERSRRRLVALTAMLVTLGIVAASGLASGLIGGAASDVTLPAWRSNYAWSAGDGYFGWHRQLLTSDAQAYGLEAGPGARPGLWLWPQGGRQYGPGGAEWRLTAPGTTRIARATVAVSYRNSLFAYHCLKCRPARRRQRVHQVDPGQGPARRRTRRPRQVGRPGPRRR